MLGVGRLSREVMVMPGEEAGDRERKVTNISSSVCVSTLYTWILSTLSTQFLHGPSPMHAVPVLLDQLDILYCFP